MTFETQTYVPPKDKWKSVVSGLPEVTRGRVAGSVQIDKTMPSDIVAWGKDYGAEMSVLRNGDQLRAVVYTREPDRQEPGSDDKRKYVVYEVFKADASTPPRVRRAVLTTQQAKKIARATIEDPTKAMSSYLPDGTTIEDVPYENNGRYDGNSPERHAYDAGLVWNGVLDALLPDKGQVLGLSERVAKAAGTSPDRGQEMVQQLVALRVQRGVPQWTDDALPFFVEQD